MIKLKNITLYTVLTLMIFLLVGCTGGQNPQIQDGVDQKDNDNFSNIAEKEDDQQDETIYERKDGIITETITFGEGDSFYGKIKKHKLSNTAEIEASFLLNDTEEKSEFMGDEVFIAPMMINMICGIMSTAIFVPEDLATLNDRENLQEDSDMWGYLEGHKITKLSITFIDKEDTSEIAKCVSTGEDSLEFTTYREYDPQKTLFGVKIGVIEE